MSDGFGSLFNQSFMPHAHCYLWSKTMIALQAGSDGLIALSYLIIPMALIYFVKRRKDLVFSWMFVMFAAFILGCGATHVMGIVTIWKPVYALDGFVKCATGLVSIATAISLWPLIPRALALPSPAHLALVNANLSREVEERRLVEAQLREVQAELERRVADRTAHLERANAELAREMAERLAAEEEKRKFEARAMQAQKMESLGLLAGGVAHDFNNLLVGILGHATLAEQDLPERSVARESLKQIRMASQRAGELAKQMLAYSGRGRFVVGAVKVGEIVEEMAALVEAGLPKTVSMQYELGQDVPPVQADIVQLRQVVMNLLLNASDAMTGEPGVVKVRVTKERVDRDAIEKLAATLEGHCNLEEGDHVVLEVADTGCGMDRETRSRIFDPFFTTKLTGRGLGLAAVLGIVRGHGGAISVTSELDFGTTFRVYLPALDVAAAPSIPKPREVVAKPVEATGRVVLVVDDEAIIRSLARKVLETAGCRVLLAGDGIEACDMARAHPEIAVVLLDLTMPRMSGTEAFEELRKIRPDLRVILSSGYNEIETTSRFAGAGLASFLQKPYPPKALVDAVESALRGELRDERERTS